MTGQDLEIRNDAVFKYKGQFLTLLELIVDHKYFGHYVASTKVTVIHRDVVHSFNFGEIYINGKKLSNYTMQEIRDLNGNYTLGITPAEPTYYFHFMDQTLIVDLVQGAAKFPITMIGIANVVRSGIVKELVVPAGFDTSKIPPIPIRYV